MPCWAQAGLLSAVAGAVFGFGILILLYLIGAFGAGDVKLLAGVGAWLGMPLTVYVFAAAGLATGVYSIVVLAHRGGIGRAFTVFRVFGMQLAVLGRHLGTGERIEEIVADHKSRRAGGAVCHHACGGHDYRGHLGLPGKLARIAAFESRHLGRPP